MIWSYIVLNFISLFCYGLIDNSRGPLFSIIIEDLHLSASLGAQVFAVASMAGLFINLASKWWLPSWGALKSFKVFQGGMCVGCLGMGLSGFFSYPFFWLLVFSAVFGSSCGALAVVMNILVARGSLAHKRRNYLSGLHAMYGVASLLAPLAVDLASRLGLGWRGYFIFLSIFPALIFFIGLSVKDREELKVAPSKPQSAPWNLKIIAGLLLGFYVAGEISISSWLVFYLQKHLLWASVDAYHYLSLFFLGLLGGRLVFTFITFPGQSYNWLIISNILTLVFYLAGLLVHPAGLVVCGLSMSIFFPCAMDWVSKTFPRYADSIMAAAVTFDSLALIFMHWMIGAVADNFGIHKALYLGPTFIALSTFILILYFQTCARRLSEF